MDVCAYVKSYVLETSKFRNENHGDLFLSWVTKKPVTKVSPARWLKTVLAVFAINNNDFSAHSYRGASLSSAYNKGVSLNNILKAGDRTNAPSLV